MTWLRNKASDPEDKLIYTVLSYQATSTAPANIYKNPKGRPSKTATLPSASEVAKYMTFKDQLNSRAAEPLCEEGLFSLHNVPSSPPSFVNAEPDQMVVQLEVFKGPPQFREAHTIDVSTHACGRQDVVRLTCSCGFKHRYGIVFAGMHSKNNMISQILMSDGKQRTPWNLL